MPMAVRSQTLRTRNRLVGCSVGVVIYLTQSERLAVTQRSALMWIHKCRKSGPRKSGEFLLPLCCATFDENSVPLGQRGRLGLGRALRPLGFASPSTHPALRDHCRFGEGFPSLHFPKREGISRESRMPPWRHQNKNRRPPPLLDLVLTRLGRGRKDFCPPLDKGGLQGGFSGAETTHPGGSRPLPLRAARGGDFEERVGYFWKEPRTVFPRATQGVSPMRTRSIGLFVKRNF